MRQLDHLRVPTSWFQLNWARLKARSSPSSSWFLPGFVPAKPHRIVEEPNLILSSRNQNVIFHWGTEPHPIIEEPDLIPSVGGGEGPHHRDVSWVLSMERR